MSAVTEHGRIAGAGRHAMVLTAALVMLACVTPIVAAQEPEETSRDPGLPQVIAHPPPVYPEAARRAGVTGVVLVMTRVGSDGRVRETRIARSIPKLDDAATTAVKRWTFKPAIHDGKPVESWIMIPVRFDAPASPAGATPATAGAGHASDASRAAETAPRVMSGPKSGFDADLAALRSLGPRAPSDTDAVLRERIIRAWRKLESRPEPSLDAQRRFERGRRAIAVDPSVSVAEWTLPEFAQALRDAPWWGDVYREMARSQELLGDVRGAMVSLDLYLVAEPEAKDWEEVRTRLHELRERERAGEH